jgi:galactoside O-acetyltransferase
MAYTDVEYKFKRIGKNVSIGKYVYFRYPELVEIGDNVIIDEFCYFTSSLTIGNYVHIASHCTCIGGKNSKLIMSDFSGLSAGCRIICGSDDYLCGLTNPNIPSEFRGATKIGEIFIGKHAVLGTNTVVHPLVRINEGAATGSLTLVTKDLESWSIYVGVPANKIKDRDRASILKLESDFLNSIQYETNNKKC